MITVDDGMKEEINKNIDALTQVIEQLEKKTSLNEEEINELIMTLNRIAAYIFVMVNVKDEYIVKALRNALKSFTFH